MMVVEMLRELLNLSTFDGNIEIKQDKSLMRPKDVTLQIPDCSKLHSTIDWEPEIEFEKTLKDTLDYWRSRV